MSAPPWATRRLEERLRRLRGEQVYGPTPPTELPKAWKDKAAELRRLLSDCKHDGRVLEDADGKAVCERCGAAVTG